MEDIQDIKEYRRRVSKQRRQNAIRAANRDKVNAKRKAWYAANREQLRIKRHAQGAMEMFRSAKRRAKSRNIPFTITVKDIIIPEYCPVLGIKLERNSTRGGLPQSPSLDRIKPELGYVPGNVQVISNRANTIKSNATPEELMMVARYYGNSG